MIPLRIFLSVALSSLPVAVCAQSEAVVAVEARQGGGPSRDAGNGVCVQRKDGYALVLTAYHVVEGRDVVTVTFPSRVRCQGHVAAADVGHDLAAVLIKCPKDSPIPFRPVAKKDVERGEFVMVIGDSSEVDEPVRVGKRMERIVNGETPFEFQSDVRVGSGDSGGGMFNDREELVSITSGFWSVDSKKRGHGPDTKHVRELVGKVKWPQGRGE